MYRSMLQLMFLVEEGRLSSVRQQSLPMLLVGPQTVLISTDHLLDRHHRYSVLQMANREVGVPAHQTLDAAQCDLAK